MLLTIYVGLNGGIDVNTEFAIKLSGKFCACARLE